MGYIANEASDLSDFSQAVISIWFRIPQAEIDAAIAQYEAIDVEVGSLTDWNMPGIIPLFTFGVPAAVTGAAFDNMSRCFIGVSCGHITNDSMLDEDPLPAPRLVVFLQYDTGSASTGSPPTCSDFIVIGQEMGMLNPNNALLEGQFVTVTADDWHHALVSFDLSSGCETTYNISNTSGISFDQPSQLWLAFDDVNYNEDYLWPSNPNCYDGDTGGANDIYSNGCLGINAVNGPRTLSGNLPISGNPTGIPASSDDVSHVYNIIMTEVQIFTDVSLDTSIEDNRRLFVTSLGRPASPTLAADFFGKEPEIYFQTHEDAATGNNRGTAADFEPTGTISQFTPGP